MNGEGPKYLMFRSIPNPNGKTEIWSVDSKSGGFPLGQIKWFGRWRQYCFFPASDTIFNTDCMRDISAKIKEVMARRKMGARLKKI